MEILVILGGGIIVVSAVTCAVVGVVFLLKYLGTFEGAVDCESGPKTNPSESLIKLSLPSNPGDLKDFIQPYLDDGYTTVGVLTNSGSSTQILMEKF